jgi:ferredoxin
VKVTVDWDKCDSQGVCTNLCPEVFDLNDDDVLEILDENPPEALRPEVESAARACPKGDVQIDGTPTELERHVQLAVHRTRPQVDLRGRLAPAEKVLRKRRTVLGQVRLVADEDQLTTIAVPAQCLERMQARERCADHHDLLHIHLFTRVAGAEIADAGSHPVNVHRP